MAPTVKETTADVHEPTIYDREWDAVYTIIRMSRGEGNDGHDPALKLHIEGLKRISAVNRGIPISPRRRKGYEGLLRLGRGLAEERAARSRQEALRVSNQDGNSPVTPSVAPEPEAHTTTTPPAMDSNFISDNVKSLDTL